MAYESKKNIDFMIFDSPKLTDQNVHDEVGNQVVDIIYKGVDRSTSYFSTNNNIGELPSMSIAPSVFAKHSNSFSYLGYTVEKAGHSLNSCLARLSAKILEKEGLFDSNRYVLDFDYRAKQNAIFENILIKSGNKLISEDGDIINKG